MNIQTRRLNFSFKDLGMNILSTTINLPNILKRSKEKSKLSTVFTSAGNIVQTPEEVNNTFKNFYIELYSSTNTKVKDIDTFLNNINLPHLTEDQVKEPDKPLTPTEALELIPNNKSPGPDGFPAEF